MPAPCVFCGMRAQSNTSAVLALTDNCPSRDGSANFMLLWLI